MAFAGYLKQSTAVDILIGPFVDDTDGKTAETGLTIDVEVSKNGQALADKNDATDPVHDAAGTVDGYYNCELDTTDTGTLGILTIVAHAAGFLPVRLDYQIVTANWYDTMCSTDQLDVNVTDIEGSDATDQITASAPTAAVIADAVWDEAASGHVAAGSFGQQCGTDIDAILTDTGELQTDWANGGRLDLLIDAILTDTGELQTDWANGGRLDLLIDAIKAITDALPDSGALNDLATILTDTNELQADDVPTLIAALNDISAADVNAQVDDVISTDTQSLPGQAAPSATPTAIAALMFLYKLARNKIDQDATTLQIYADNGSTVDQKATISDDGSTYTRGEIGTGP